MYMYVVRMAKRHSWRDRTETFVKMYRFTWWNLFTYIFTIQFGFDWMYNIELLGTLIVISGTERIEKLYTHLLTHSLTHTFVCTIFDHEHQPGVFGAYVCVCVHVDFVLYCNLCMILMVIHKNNVVWWQRWHCQ